MMEPPRASSAIASQVGRTRRSHWPQVAAALAALLANACALQTAAQTSPSPRAAPDPAVASRLSITQLLALSCTQAADCATVGVGARACGGPEEFVAYAARETPGPALRAALQRHATLRKKQLEERGEMSTCEVLPDPGAHCSAAGQCQLQPLRFGPAGRLIR